MAVQEEGELVAAEPRDHLALPEDVGRTRRDDREQLVAHRVAEGVIDAFEVVEVEQQQRTARVGQGEPLAHVLAQGRRLGSPLSSSVRASRRDVASDCSCRSPQASRSNATNTVISATHDAGRGTCHGTRGTSAARATSELTSGSPTAAYGRGARTVSSAASEPPAAIANRTNPVAQSPLQTPVYPGSPLIRLCSHSASPKNTHSSPADSSHQERPGRQRKSATVPIMAIVRMASRIG